MIKLMGTKTLLEEDVEFGTCELCMSTGDLVREFYVFEDDGKVEYLELGYWDWGDYHTAYGVDNIVDFASFLDTKEIKTFDEVRRNIAIYHEEYLDILDHYSSFFEFTE